MFNLDLKKPCLEAQEIEPDLVERETPKIHFLKVEDFDPVAAAKRFALYWKYRKQLFRERWLLPLNLTGKGALSMNDVEYAKTGYVTLAYDAAGRGVFIQDHSRLTSFRNEELERGAFYWASVFDEQAAPTRCFRFLYVVSGAPVPVPSCANRSWNIAKEALPIKLLDVLVVQGYDEIRQALIDYMAFQTTRMVSYLSGMPVEHVCAGSAQANLRLLEQRGLGRDLIPTSVQGNYSYKQFDDLIRVRLSVEDIMSSAPPVVNASLWDRRRGRRRRHGNLPNAADTAAYPTTIVPRPRKRKAVEISERSSVYSKRYYNRKKQKEVMLRDESDLLSTQNGKLRSENARLEGLIDRARGLIAMSDGDGTSKW